METSQGPEAGSEGVGRLLRDSGRGLRVSERGPSLCEGQVLETLMPAGDDRLGCGDKWQAEPREPCGAHLGLSVTGTHSNPGLF